MVRVGDAFGDGEAQAVPALAPVPGRVRPVKVLKQVGQVLGRDGRAGVVDGQAHLVLLAGQGEGDSAPGTGIFDGVVQ